MASRPIVTCSMCSRATTTNKGCRDASFRPRSCSRPRRWKRSGSEICQCGELDHAARKRRKQLARYRVNECITVESLVGEGDGDLLRHDQHLDGAEALAQVHEPAQSAEWP